LRDGGVITTQGCMFSFSLEESVRVSRCGTG
jgi:hypothetical protein